MTTLKPGLRGRAETMVKQNLTAEVVGSGTVPVFATPMLVALMEKAALAALGNLLPGEKTSVGTRVELHHQAPTPLEMTVTAEAELLAVEGSRLDFAVKAWDEQGPVAEGNHQRVILDRERFLASAEKRRKKK